MRQFKASYMCQATEARARMSKSTVARFDDAHAFSRSFLHVLESESKEAGEQLVERLRQEQAFARGTDAVRK